MLRDDSRSNGLCRPRNRPLMQHRKPPLIASLDWRGPGIGFIGLRMAVDFENVHDAFPYRFAAESLCNRHGLGKRGGAAVLRFDCPFKLQWVYFALQITTPVFR